MATTNKIFIQDGENRIELTGADKEAFLIDLKERQEQLKKELEQLEAQKELKISAYKKLGLTDEEIQAII